MKVLKAIGNFFARIWRWIKETAWVQPLLIVSLIFGIILLIQPISQGVTALADLITNNEKYYKDNQVKLANGSARKLIYDEDTRFKDNDKYFLVFLQSDCSNCKEAYSAWKTLFEDKTFAPEEGKGSYVLKTIYVDEQIKSYELTDKLSEINKIFFSDYNDDYDIAPTDFRKAIYAAAENASHEYGMSAWGNNETKFHEILDGGESCDPDLWTPLILLMNKESENAFNIQDALIGIDGSSKYDKARVLYDCWNETGDFELKK